MNHIHITFLFAIFSKVWFGKIWIECSIRISACKYMTSKILGSLQTWLKYKIQSGGKHMAIFNPQFFIFFSYSHLRRQFCGLNFSFNDWIFRTEVFYHYSSCLNGFWPKTPATRYQRQTNVRPKTQQTKKSTCVHGTYCIQSPAERLSPLIWGLCWSNAYGKALINC